MEVADMTAYPTNGPCLACDPVELISLSGCRL